MSFHRVTRRLFFIGNDYLIGTVQPACKSIRVSEAQNSDKLFHRNVLPINGRWWSDRLLYAGIHLRSTAYIW